MSFEKMSFLLQLSFFSVFLRKKKRFASLKSKTQFFAKNTSLLEMWVFVDLFLKKKSSLLFLSNSYCQPDPSYVHWPLVLVGPGYVCDAGAAFLTTRRTQPAFATTLCCKRKRQGGLLVRVQQASQQFPNNNHFQNANGVSTRRNEDSADDVQQTQLPAKTRNRHSATTKHQHQQTTNKQFVLFVLW